MVPYCTYCLCYSLTVGSMSLRVCVCVCVFESGHCNSLTAGSLSTFIHTQMKSPSDSTTSSHLNFYLDPLGPFRGLLVCMFACVCVCVNVTAGLFSFFTQSLSDFFPEGARFYQETFASKERVLQGFFVRLRFH